MLMRFHSFVLMPWMCGLRAGTLHSLQKEVVCHGKDMAKISDSYHDYAAVYWL